MKPLPMGEAGADTPGIPRPFFASFRGWYVLHLPIVLYTWHRYVLHSGKRERPREKKEMKYDKEIAALKARMETETDKVKKLDLGLALHACLQVQTEIREAKARIASFEAHADRMLQEVA